MKLREAASLKTSDVDLNRAIMTPVGALSMHEEMAAAAAAEEAGTRSRLALVIQPQH